MPVVKPRTHEWKPDNRNLPCGSASSEAGAPGRGLCPLEPARAGTGACSSRVHKPAQCLKAYRAWNPKQRNLQAVQNNCRASASGRAAPLRSPCSDIIAFNAHNNHAEAAQSGAWCRKQQQQMQRRMQCPQGPHSLKSLRTDSAVSVCLYYLQNLRASSPAIKANPPHRSAPEAQEMQSLAAGALLPGTRRCHRDPHLGARLQAGPAAGGAVCVPCGIP